MRVGEIESSALTRGGLRLTASYFLPRDVAAAQALDRSNYETEPLADLCKPDGIFRGPIFKRIPAQDARFGRPYVKPSQLERLNVGIDKYLSHLHGDLLDELALEHGMILVTCSGKSLGKVIFARADLDGLVASHDLIRVCPDPDRIHPGYLFAYMSSRIGKVVIRRQIYGTSVVHIGPELLFDLPIIRLGDDRERAIGDAVLKAQAAISAGLREIASAKAELQQDLGLGGEDSDFPEDEGE